MNEPGSRPNQVRARNRAAIAKTRSSGKTSDRVDKPGLATRRTAHRLLGAIVDTHTSLDALTDDKHGNPHYLALDLRDRALLRAILMVALRYRADLSDVLARFIDKPLPSGASALQNVLHVALAQIFFLDVPDHSAVDLAVESANRDPRLKRFAPLVNAVTRRAVRQKTKVIANIMDGVPKSSPWFTQRIIEVYGAEKAAAIESAHRLEAPLDITVKNDEEAEKWASALEAEILPNGSLRRSWVGTDIPLLAGFGEGAWWVQDAAASIPARLFENLEGLNALDLCAAPGGKTAQLLSLGAHVTALDMSANRLKRLEENLQRLALGKNCSIQNKSLFDYQSDQKFDAVLLDAPCSSTGTIRRHPDIPWTKTADDVAKLADLQTRMLEKAASFVAPGGSLVFSNCSLDPMEGEEVARDFASENNDLELVPISPAQMPGLEDCINEEGFARTTPADLSRSTPELSGMDGFFAAVFKRKK